MPIYEYQCKACGHEYETLQKMSDKPLIHCPACTEPELKKKISAAGFRLKGDGWYETDFKSGNKRNVAGESTGTDKTKTKSKPGESTGTDKTKSKPGGCNGGGCSTH